MHERGGSANLLCWKVNPHGLVDPDRLQEARRRWLRELAVQESKIARVGRPGKVARGTRKVSLHGLADRARSQEAGARWLGEPAVEEIKLALDNRPSNLARGTREVARRTCGGRNKLARTGQGCKRHERGGSVNLRCRKVSSQGLAYPTRLQEERARWLSELAMQESKLARVSRLGKVARGLSEVARRTCGAEKKVSSHGLADPAMLQEARARCLGELAVQEGKLARVSRPGKVARGTSEVARRTCGAGKKVSLHELADRARLQEARARWLGELAVQEGKLARVSRPGKVARGTSEVARRTCGARNYTRTG
ncbi:hypothetical protein CRG98_041300 [Punica granatum]|uniref:Uncharacterized protein n=1 Tax=Punica granatum TaxID=22663 RepID=A0A2I0I2T3_PUNGR|nr:hypothetical protein CRG98_041300 [Punica granatum]